ncbi:helix-turn-helix transcriptional regulator [Mesorhizobium sp. YC-39]|uniref:ATP-binding protein n=1 Tax=unclassified Mesorhizobium TaxID=325217 RepID=UPI0021E773DE|nr:MULTISPECIES: helix-turn-helix transcriptional regulator [unclassified Mesorhizobium]MCV3206507.1 helix-turn-helix transcriptional regulator [Mesorhizobium sp. YC-2]MCV3227093.1 helix-turn-helix transcriptional regulator [Mesorhizobium sp. YC-39]
MGPPGAGSAVTNGGELSFGSFRLIGAERVLLRDGKPVAIGGRALDVLIALTGRPGEVVSGRELIDLVWPGVFVEEANLRVHIAALRKVLGGGKDGVRYIVNVPGRGYTFVAPVRRSGAGGTAPIAARANPARPANFPSPSQLLVGRSETVTTLSSLLLSRRFVSVVGPGGIGKTTVAVAVANALRQEFGDDAVCFVVLGSLTNPADVPSAVASALGCFVQGPDHEPYIRAFLADKRILVVLDNCEHVIETAAPLCERLFRAAPSVHLLTTSREALRVESENVYLLMPLDSPLDDTPSAVQALATPAVQLFMKKAASSGYEAQLSDTDAPIVAEICRRLDGIALAIELVASRVGTHGIQGTANLLDSSAGLFLQGRRSALPRHQTLQAMLDWSFRLLSADEQRILCRLSVFVGQFTLAATHAVAGDAGGKTLTVTNAIFSLADKSLIWISSTGGPAYYRLPDTTRAYAATKLAESGEAEATARRHACYFAGLLKQGMAKGSAFDGPNVAVHAPHIDNVRKALAWSFSSSDDRSLAIELAAHAAPLFLGLSLLDECQQWCRRALGALREADHGTRWELELQGALAMSSMYARGNSLEVRAGIERGLELSEILQDGRHQLQLLSGLYIFLTRQGDFSGALAAAKRSAAVAKASGGPTENAMTEWMLGGSYHLTGNQAAALRHCKQGSKLASDFRLGRVSFFGHDHHVSGLATLARSLWLCGFADQGCKVARQGIKRAQSYDHPVSYCIALIYLVPVLHWSGDFRAAEEHTEIVIEQAIKYSLAPYRAVSLALKGELMVARGDAPSGVEILRAGLKAMDADQYRIVTLPTRRALAEGLALSGRPQEALATIDEAVARAEQIGEILWLPDLLRARGEILLTQPRPDLPAAERALLRSIDCARKQSALSWQLRAAIPLARLWKEHDRGKDARSMLEDIHQRFTEGFGTQDLVAARRLLEELNSTN